MTVTLADHARRGAQEAADLLYRVRRVKTGYEAREPSDARDRAIDAMTVWANDVDNLAFYLDALAKELQTETETVGADTPTVSFTRPRLGEAA